MEWSRQERILKEKDQVYTLSHFIILPKQLDIIFQSLVLILPCFSTSTDHKSHCDSCHHLLHTNVGDEILPLLSFFHILAIIQYFLQISNVFSEFNSYLSFLWSASRLSRP